ncbi:MAG: DoxX family protein [Myxococcota bacterium]
MNTKTVVIARYLLGGAFLLFGLNGFLAFMPVPPARPDAERFIRAIIETGYFFQMVKAIEVASGLLLILNRWVPLALVLLAPLLWCITSIHLFLNAEGLPLMLVLFSIYAYLVYAFRPSFRGLLVKAPASGAERVNDLVEPRRLQA